MLTANGGKVTLTGVVRSWSERDMVGDLVWNTPEVTDVTTIFLWRTSAFFN